MHRIYAEELYKRGDKRRYKNGTDNIYSQKTETCSREPEKHEKTKTFIKQLRF